MTESDRLPFIWTSLITKLEDSPQEGLHLTWPTKPGNVYRIEVSVNLTDWEAYGDPITAEGASASVTLPRGEEGQRFVRVEFVEE